MDGVNKTLYIPLYSKAQISKKGIILSDKTAEKIWDAEQFPLHGQQKSKWLAYNMAMRARIFDDWTDSLLKNNPDALVLHIGCGLDSRCKRVKELYHNWNDCDFPEVIEVRKRYYDETGNYHMRVLNASDSKLVKSLPEADEAIIVFEGISMYIKREDLREFFRVLNAKYKKVHVLMDVYTEFGIRASKYKNPVNSLGVTNLYGIDNIEDVLTGTSIRLKEEHTFTPKRLVDELAPADRFFFKMLFTGRIYRKIYRLFELEK